MLCVRNAQQVLLLRSADAAGMVWPKVADDITASIFDASNTYMDCKPGVCVLHPLPRPPPFITLIFLMILTLIAVSSTCLTSPRLALCPRMCTYLYVRLLISLSVSMPVYMHVSMRVSLGMRGISLSPPPPSHHTGDLTLQNTTFDLFLQAMAAGADLLQANMTASEAKAWCLSNATCAGFTAKTPAAAACASMETNVGGRLGSNVLQVYFKSRAGSNIDATWSSWTKPGPPGTLVATGPPGGILLHSSGRIVAEYYLMGGATGSSAGNCFGSVILYNPKHNTPQGDNCAQTNEPYGFCKQYLSIYFDDLYQILHQLFFPLFFRN